MTRCKQEGCISYALNPESGLCDRCYWKVEAEKLTDQLDQAGVKFTHQNLQLAQMRNVLENIRLSLSHALKCNRDRLTTAVQFELDKIQSTISDALSAPCPSADAVNGLEKSLKKGVWRLQYARNFYSGVNLALKGNPDDLDLGRVALKEWVDINEEQITELQGALAEYRRRKTN